MTFATQTVLILWLTGFQGKGAYTDGALVTATFNSFEACHNALVAVKQEAKQVNGLCAPVSNPTK